MQKAGYPPEVFKQHREEHQAFIEKMLWVEAEVKQDAGAVSKQLLDFLVEWLGNHILKTDKVMAIGLNKGVDLGQIKFDEHEQFEILHSNLYSALRESEDRFKELADNLPALIWITNAKNQPIFYNRFWFKTFGIKHGRWQSGNGSTLSTPMIGGMSPTLTEWRPPI